MDIVLFGLLAVLVIFMFVNGRKRQQKMKAEQEEKATKTVPGVKVLMQGGIYGTIVAYDHDDLDSPALVEIAPGTIIEVHSQAILRIVEPKTIDQDDAVIASTESGIDHDEPVIAHEAPAVAHDQPVVAAGEPAVDAAPASETSEESRARLEREADGK